MWLGAMDWKIWKIKKRDAVSSSDERHPFLIECLSKRKPPAMLVE